MERGFKMKFFVIILALTYSTSVNADNNNDDNHLAEESENADNSEEAYLDEPAESPPFTNKTIVKHGDTKSIVFVLDTSSDLSEIKTRISKDFGKFENHINYSYSLVRFNETDASSVIENGPLQSFNKELIDLQSRSNKAECERKSLDGIQEGLNGIMSDSFMIVVTNGEPAEDEKLLSKIVSTIAEKRIRVYFILTGKCHIEIPQGYQNIAAVGNGQIFEIGSRDNISQLLKLMTNSTRVDLLAVDSPFEKNKASKDLEIKEVFVDDTMTEILISVHSTKYYNLKVFYPSGEGIKNLNSSCNHFLEISRLKVCSIQKPKTGKWKISVVNATATYSLRVSAVSSMKINFGFDTNPKPTASNLTFCQPFPDKKNNFYVNLDESSLKASVSSAKIISIEGKELSKSLNMKKMTSTQNLYFSDFKFSNSDSLFHLQITGTTNGKLTYQRITPVAFGGHSDNSRNGLQNCTLPYITYIEDVSTPKPTPAPKSTPAPKPTPEPKSTPGPVKPETANSTEELETNSTTDAAINSTTPDPNTKAERKDGMSTLWIILSIIGVLLVVALLIVGLVIYMKPAATYKVHQVFVRNRSVAKEEECAS